MDTTAFLRGWSIALMEAALGGSSPMAKFRLELTITSIPAWRYMQSTTPFSRQAYFTAEELSSILQSLHASNAGTSSGTLE